MKKNFKGKFVLPQCDEWAKTIQDNEWLSSDAISLSTTTTHQPKCVIGTDYYACEYKIKLNILSFGKFKINLPFTVVAPPISIDSKGVYGSLNNLIEDYKCQKGLFLILNLKHEELEFKNKVAVGKTLPSCIFKNRFASFDSYFNALRSNYRRRIKIALEKCKNLKIVKINNSDFDEKLYDLYLQVLHRSEFPLETLPMIFFQNCGCDIDVFYHGANPIAFVMHNFENGNLNFIFGGMDYKVRDEFDLYYNMLLYLLKTGICKNAKQINLGQTAESSKLRIGCELENRYMISFSGNSFLNALLCLFAPLLQNNKKHIDYKPFNH